jgi:predicted Fe-Mo cluster-binding NifX family protein
LFAVPTVAIALFGDEVSPRFCYAEKVLVVNIEEGQVTWRNVVSLGDPWLPGRMSQLSAMGVGTLLCGAFNRAYLPNAERLGIRVLTGISGNAEAAVAKFRRAFHVAQRAKQRRGQMGELDARSSPDQPRTNHRGHRGH